MLVKRERLLNYKMKNNLIVMAAEKWTPDRKFLSFLKEEYSSVLEEKRFIVFGEKKTLNDLILEMEAGSSWGRRVYEPLYKAYICGGPLMEQYAQWLQGHEFCETFK